MIRSWLQTNRRFPLKLEVRARIITEHMYLNYINFHQSEFLIYNTVSLTHLDQRVWIWSLAGSGTALHCWLFFWTGHLIYWCHTRGMSRKLSEHFKWHYFKWPLFKDNAISPPYSISFKTKETSQSDILRGHSSISWKISKEVLTGYFWLGVTDKYHIFVPSSHKQDDLLLV